MKCQLTTSRLHIRSTLIHSTTLWLSPVIAMSPLTTLLQATLLQATLLQATLLQATLNTSYTATIYANLDRPSSKSRFHNMVSTYVRACPYQKTVAFPAFSLAHRLQRDGLFNFWFVFLSRFLMAASLWHIQLLFSIIPVYSSATVRCQNTSNLW
jgi:hypothetical protein